METIMSDLPPIIACDNVTRRFGSTEALRGVSLHDLRAGRGSAAGP